MPHLKLSQPHGFYTVTFGELCERFSYYGAQTLLVLYLTQKFLVSADVSYSLYEAYATFAYALPVLGGLLADRLLGLKQAILIGGLLLIIGNVLMAASELNGFYIGLALVACGTGLYKPNSTTFVGKLYDVKDIRQEGGFTLFYMGMNIGATASPFVYGFMEQWGFQYAYLISTAFLSTHEISPAGCEKNLAARPYFPLLTNQAHRQSGWLIRAHDLVNSLCNKLTACMANSF